MAGYCTQCGGSGYRRPSQQRRLEAWEQTEIILRSVLKAHARGESLSDVSQMLDQLRSHMLTALPEAQ